MFVDIKGWHDLCHRLVWRENSQCPGEVKSDASIGTLVLDYLLGEHLIGLIFIWKQLLVFMHLFINGFYIVTWIKLWSFIYLLETKIWFSVEKILHLNKISKSHKQVICTHVHPSPQHACNHCASTTFTSQNIKLIRNACFFNNSFIHTILKFHKTFLFLRKNEQQ